MILSYSLGVIEHNWITEALPFEQFCNKRIKVSSQHTHFQFFEPALLLSAHHDAEGYVTILGEFRSGTTPPSTRPIPTGRWEDTPNSPIIQQVRIALDADAIRQIKPVSAQGYDFELDIPPHAAITRQE